jgi:hypothetical protein
MLEFTLFQPVFQLKKKKAEYKSMGVAVPVAQ